jgi:YD repeat-containing protein
LPIRLSFDARTTFTGNGQYTHTFGYDLTGNIITRTASAMQWYAYNTPPSMPYKAYLTLVMRIGDTYGSPPLATLYQPFAVISTTAGFQAVYDKNGNMLTRVEMSSTQSITYTQAWDVENRLSVVTNTITGQVTQFAYNADGARVLQILPDGGKTVYVGPLEVSITGTQRITKTYYTVGAQMVALRVISSTGNVLLYARGSPGQCIARDERGGRGRGAAVVRSLRPVSLVKWGDADGCGVHCAAHGRHRLDVLQCALLLGIAGTVCERGYDGAEPGKSTIAESVYVHA